MAAAPLMFNTLVQIRDHLNTAGEGVALPFRVQLDLRAALDHANQPAYTVGLAPDQP